MTNNQLEHAFILYNQKAKLQAIKESIEVELEYFNKPHKAGLPCKIQLDDADDFFEVDRKSFHKFLKSQLGLYVEKLAELKLEQDKYSYDV